MWSKQSYRMGPQDFTANKDEGVAIDWPVRYGEIKPGTIMLKNLLV